MAHQNLSYIFDYYVDLCVSDVSQIKELEPVTLILLYCQDLQVWIIFLCYMLNLVEYVGFAVQFIQLKFKSQSQLIYLMKRYDENIMPNQKTKDVPVHLLIETR